jgi:hypothetical protein
LNLLPPMMHPKARVLATEISAPDTAAELAELKATVKALSAQLRGDTSGAKRARNGVPVEKKPIHQCALFVANGGTMLRIDTMLRTNWTRTKPTHSTWPRRLVTRRRQTWPSASRMAKKQRLTPLLLLPLKPRRPLRPPGTTPRVMCPYMDFIDLPHRSCLIKSSCLIRPRANQ